MKKKLMYEVPEAEQLFVKYEENIMSPTYNDDNNQTPDDGGEEDF